MRKRFEYYIVIDHSNFYLSDINKLGEEGWELVTITTCPTTGKNTFYFKRELSII